jgi:hypothetical protein
MKIGLANEETWAFLSEIYDDLSLNHHTSLFKIFQPSCRLMMLFFLNGPANSYQ